MEASIQGTKEAQFPLNLLLFIDKRPSSAEQVRAIRRYLKTLEEHFDFNLEVVDVGEQPYMAEYYKLVASPALIKIAPLPQQTIAGSDIVRRLEKLWPRWYREAEAVASTEGNGTANETASWQKSTQEVSHSTEVMKLSDEIFRQKQTIQELEAHLRFKNRIIAMLAHDLRNPLTAASIAVETLEMGNTPSEAQTYKLSPELTRQLLKHARVQIKAIDRMVTDILKTAKGASAELQMQPKELDLRALYLEVVESFSDRLAQRQQQITSDVPQSLPSVYADAFQVRRVIVNLLDNAIKYTPVGGKIEVTALHRTTQKVQVAIHDTGPGIPPENQQEVFEESYRLQRDHSKDGYGLGLALCQRIIRAHYGQIWVDSVPGEGSYFYFTLPVYRE